MHPCNVGRFMDVILDEIGLDGLEGLTIDGLWTRLSIALKIPTPFYDKFKTQIWSFILKHPKDILFYELPKPRAKLKTFVRHELVDPEVGLPVTPPECPFTVYKFCPVEKDGVKGSCEDYDTRVRIPHETVKTLTVDQVIELWGDKFVMVGSQDLRNKALFPLTISPNVELPNIHYCYLERIGRSRYNGETTIGKYSLLTFNNDSRFLFYTRTILCNLKLVVKQPYSEKMTITSANGYLLTLPRFYVEFKTKSMWYLETIIQYIKSKPCKTADYNELRSLFGEKCDGSLKKLYNTALYKKFMDFGFRVPYRTVYPDALPSEWQCKSRNVEKMLHAVTLKDPNIDINTIWNNDEQGIEEKETNDVTFYDSEHAYLDMPMWKQVYQIIASFGAEGCSAAELKSILGVNKLIMRHIVKYVCTNGLATFYLKDEGRQRLKKYVLHKYLPDVAVNVQEVVNISNEIESVEGKAETTDPIMEILEQIEAEPPKITSTANDAADDCEMNEATFRLESQIPNLELVVKRLNFDENSTSKRALCIENCTRRQKERLNFISSMINTHKIVDSVKLIKMITTNELLLGYKDKICKKSVARLYGYLQRQNLLQGFNIKISSKDHCKQQTFICHASVNETHPLLLERIEKLRVNFPYDIAQRIRRETSLAQKREMKKMDAQNEAKEPERRHAPRFMRMKILHELLFYLVYQLPNDKKPHTFTEVLQSVNDQSINVDMEPFKDDLPPVYSLELNWKTFINPIPEYENYPNGWAYVHDVIQRFPLSMYVSFHNIKSNASSLLEEYMMHPIKKHFLLTFLPPELKAFLVGDKLIYAPVDETLRRMCIAGVVQLGDRQLRDKFYVYLNRNLKLLDTSKSEKAYEQVSTDKEYKAIYYYLSDEHDIEKYWFELQQICMSTKLGHRICKKPLPQPVPKLDKVSTVPPSVSPNDAPINDIGYLPGDNRGAAGLDTAFYAFVPRNWAWYSKKQPSVGRRLQPRYHERFTKFLRHRALSCGPKIKRLTAAKTDRLRLANRTKVAEKNKKTRTYDKVDKDALKRMTKLRVTWYDEEDRLLLLCRVAFSYLNLNFGNQITSHTYRDILHWRLNSLNKTSRACQRRINYITKKKPYMDRMEIWSQEATQNQCINQLYGPNFMENLKKVYRNANDFLTALRIHFVNLVYYLDKVIEKSEAEGEKALILPETLKEFYSLYEERKSGQPPQCINHFDPITKEEVDLSTLNAFIHASVCCIKDKTLYNIQSFEVFKRYSEDILSKAATKICDDRLVVAKKSRFASAFQPLNLKGKVYHIANNYCHLFFVQLPYRVIDECYQSFKHFISKVFEDNTADEKKHLNKIYAEYTTVTSGTALFIAELSQNPNFIFEIQTPRQVLKVDPSMAKDTKCSEKILERFRELFCMAPKQDYSKEFEQNTVEETEKAIKFNFNIDTIKIRTNPYDFISKISEANFHSFCVLSNLHKNFNTSKIEITEEKLCPFAICLLDNEDYLAKIEELVKSNAEIIEKIFPNQLQENYEELPKGEFQITLENAGQIYGHVNNLMKSLNKQQDLKDCGKVSVQKNDINFSYLSKEIIEYNLEQDDADEYDTIEQKYDTEFTDKVNRFHDSLVVNTPKLMISPVGFTNDVETVNFQNITLPNCLPQFNIDRDRILKKVLQDALWEDGKLSEEDLIAVLEVNGVIKDDIDFTLNVLNFIKQFEIGASADQLKAKFEDEYKLVKATEILRELKFIKRLGVYSYYYVYKKNVGLWIINTYHIKRLERESIPPESNLSKPTSSKRKANEEADHIEGEPSVKRNKVDDDEEVDLSDLEDSNLQKTDGNPEVIEVEGRGKRQPKPVERYSDGAVKKTVNLSAKQREPVKMRPAPWIRVNGTLNRRVLDKWMGTILNEIISFAGQTLYKLCVRFYHLHPVNVRFLLEILEDIGCVKLKVYRTQGDISLFTNSVTCCVEDATDFSDMEDVFVLVEPNAITNMAYFIGDKKYTSEFV